MSDNEYLNSSITASSIGIDAVDTVNLPNLSSQLNSINNLGNTITSVPWDYYDYGRISTDTCSISISNELKDRSHLEKKINEVLDDVLDFCDNFCVLKCEDICDGESKSQCPLWNRLKCEKRV